jgi:hypothetical protein
MTSVLEVWDRQEPPPPGCIPGSSSSVFKLHRHKLSYAPPNQPTIWVQRDGFAFEHFIEIHQTAEHRDIAHRDQLERFLDSRTRSGEYHTSRTLDEIYQSIHMSRKEGRAALAMLKAQGRVFDIPLPRDSRQGRKQTFLCPLDLLAQYGAIDEK